jgi:DNA-binding GntR family transcriptional regulator
MANDTTLLSERVRRGLADDIASGAIAEGAALDEQQIAQRFDASRTPVREALRMLAAEGLVDMRPRRGAVVSTLSIERITEMFELAAEIEAMCVRLATYRMNALERAQIQRIHIESEDPVIRSNVDAYATYNLAFHEAIYRATHNSFMAEQALSLRARMAAFRRAQLFDRGRPTHSRAEHGAIVEAIMMGDGDEAARRMRAHMLHAASAMERHVKAPVA